MSDAAPEKTAHITEGMKNITVGLLGTGAAITLKQWSDAASAAAATLTAIYMAFKCFDWLRGKYLAYHKKKRKH